VVLSAWPSRALSFLAVAAVLAACGCGARLVPVKGTASVDGKKLTSGSVRFIPDKGKGNTLTAEPISPISEDGAYELLTEGQRGAPPGWYKVVVTSVETVDTSTTSAPPPKSLVAGKYGQPDTTDILIEVKPGAGDAAYDLKLSPPGKTEGPGGIPKMPGQK
jgi:hypothetical protein